MGIFKLINRIASERGEEEAKKYTPNTISELKPIDELREDFSNPKLRGLTIRLAISAFALSEISMAAFYTWLTTKSGDTIYLTTICRNFAKGVVFWFSLIVVILTVGITYKLYRSKKHLIRDEDRNFLISENGTYGNAHFQTDKEIEEHFNIYDSIGDAEGEILFIDREDRAFVLKDDAEHRRDNHNVIYYGGSGAGKTASVVKTSMYQALKAGDSIICTDTKGDLYRDTSALFRKEGYIVRVLNLTARGFKNSDAFNPLFEIKPGHEQAAEIASTIANVTLNSLGMATGGDSTVWRDASFNLLKCLILYVCDEEQTMLGHNNIPYIYELISTEDTDSLRARIMKHHNHAGDPVLQAFNLYTRANDKFQGNVITNLGVSIQALAGGAISEGISHNEIDLILPMKKKCIYYVVMSDNDDTFKAIAALFFSLAAKYQSDYSDDLSKAEKKKQLPVHYILDEYANTGGISNLDHLISVTRSRKMWITIILQDKNQLIRMYGGDEAPADTIINNCFIKGILNVNDPKSQKMFSEMLGTMTVLVQQDKHTESSANITHIHPQNQLSYSEQKRALVNPEEFSDGTIESDEIIYIIKGQPPVIGIKPWAEKSGKIYHPFEQAALDLGERPCKKHLPKWRKEKMLEEEKAKEAEKEFEAGFTEGGDNSPAEDILEDPTEAWDDKSAPKAEKKPGKGRKSILPPPEKPQTPAKKPQPQKQSPQQEAKQDDIESDYRKQIAQAQEILKKAQAEGDADWEKRIQEKIKRLTEQLDRYLKQKAARSPQQEEERKQRANEQRRSGKPGRVSAEEQTGAW